MCLQVIPIWADFGNYGADSEVGKYLRSNEETQGYEELQSRADVAVFKVLPKIKYCAIAKVKFREPLNNSKAKCRAVENRATVLRKRRLTSNRKAGESERAKKSNRVYRKWDGLS